MARNRDYKQKDMRQNFEEFLPVFITFSLLVTGGSAIGHALRLWQVWGSRLFWFGMVLAVLFLFLLLSGKDGSVPSCVEYILITYVFFGTGLIVAYVIDFWWGFGVGMGLMTAVLSYAYFKPNKP